MLKNASKALLYHVKWKIIIGLSIGLLLMSLLPATVFGATNPIIAVDTETPTTQITAVIETTATVLDIENGTLPTITITLIGGTWELNNTTPTTQLNSLISGLTAPDKAAWSLVQTALKSGNSTSSTTNTANKYFNVDSTLKILNIALPAVPNYSPIIDQTLELTIPTTLLPQGQTAIIATGTAVIALPGFLEGIAESLETSLTNNTFTGAFANNALNQIYLRAPIKYLKSVTNTQAVISATNVNSMNIYTDSTVKSVTVNLVTTTGPSSNIYTSSSPLMDAQGRTFFNVGFTTPSTNYEAKITLTDESSETLVEVPIMIDGIKSNYTPITTDLSGSYSLYKLMNNTSLLTKILTEYDPNEMTLLTVN